MRIEPCWICVRRKRQRLRPVVAEPTRKVTGELLRSALTHCGIRLRIESSWTPIATFSRRRGCCCSGGGGPGGRITPGSGPAGGEGGACLSRG